MRRRWEKGIHRLAQPSSDVAEQFYSNFFVYAQMIGQGFAS